MSEFKNLLLQSSNGVAVVTINRPKVLNALDDTTMKELDQLCDELAQNDAIKVIIITGSGEKAFVAGADIAQMLPLSAIESRKYSKDGQATLNKLENLPQAVIAAINGFALGGGCELAMACDIRIASNKAKFGQPEVSLGITPGFGGTQRLARLVGKGRAMELLFTGEFIDAEEAYRIGLVNKVVAPDELMDSAMFMAEKIMSCSPLAVQLSKVAINEGIDADLQTGVAYEAEVFALCFSTNDQKEGMSAFQEKRRPLFTGR